jgi:hypothetical protein
LIGTGGILDTFIEGKTDASSSVMLLLDPSLQALPWEGLEFFNKYFQGRISRDFSIHMLGHRLASFATPGGKGQIPPIVSSAVKIAVDLFGEDTDCNREGYQRDSISKVVTTLKGVATGGAKWTSIGKAGSVGTICVQDWVDAVQSSNRAKPGVWFFYSPGRLGINIHTYIYIITNNHTNTNTNTYTNTNTNTNTNARFRP